MFASMGSIARCQVVGEGIATWGACNESNGTGLIDAADYVMNRRWVSTKIREEEETMHMTSGVRRTALLLGGIAAFVAIDVAAVWAGATEGKALYETKCKICHSLAGEAGKMASQGGSLDGVATKHDDAWLTAYLKDPKSQKPDSKMPKLPLTDGQIADLIAALKAAK